MTRARRRLIFLHGFTQTGRSWQPVTRLLDTAVNGLDIVTPDLPGHGTAGDQRADLPSAADQLAATWGHGTWLGYSLGGRHALHVALQHPEVVDELILIGATGGIDDAAVRAERREDDEALARSIEVSGVDAFVARWVAQPLFSGLSADRADLDDRRSNSAAGLAASLRLAGTGTQEPLWDRLGAIGAAGIATLVLAGEHDAKFRAAGERLAAAIGPSATFEVVPDAGHAAHLEQPEWLAGRLARWLG